MAAAASGLPLAAQSQGSGAGLTGPYSLSTLIPDLDLSHENHARADVTCVEYWESNLYVGTSSGEVQHYVRIPGDPHGGAESQSFILASRQDPSPSTTPSGVKQILILPRSSKACILCNGVVTFHTLPELSPAAGHRKLPNCIWLGARDLDTIDSGEDNRADTIIIAMRSKCRLVRTGQDQRPELLKDIEYPGCVMAARRGRFACVADAQNYALLDLENQQKIPLFPISSSSMISSGLGQRQDLPSGTSGVSRNLPATQDTREGSRQQTHTRTTSLGNFVSSIGRRQEDARSATGEIIARDDGTFSPRPLSVQGTSPNPSPDPPSDKPLPAPPSETSGSSEPGSQSLRFLPPNIMSPLPTEFLLTTGTGPDERGVGIFVNCEGDVVRGTLEFARYPQSLVVDGGLPSALSNVSQLENEAEGYILAAMTRGNDPPIAGLEIQRWNSMDQTKNWVALSPVSKSTPSTRAEDDSTAFGVTRTQSFCEASFQEVEERLKLRRFMLPQSQQSREDEIRNKQEGEFAQRFAQTVSNVIVWYGGSLSLAVRNPLTIRLDAQLDQIIFESRDARLDQSKLIRLMTSIRNREARSEAEFLGLDYIRQKINLLLFADLTISQDQVNPQIDESLLLEGGTDPRLMLSMVPLLHDDIFEGPGGIWIRGGLCELMESRLASTSLLLDTDEVLERPEEYDIVSLLKRYLHAWRQRKGFGSIPDEKQVFQTVDAALLHILLHQDQRSSFGPGGSTSLRAELYSVVDQKIDCFDRAVELLEDYHRLYVLSRLYQSRNLRGKVLSTWRRILDGERDNGGEFTDGALHIPQYLSKTKDPALVEEYGCWLANRDPSLGVQIFTDDNSKVKLPPQRVVEILQEKAPDAVKVYLEHLVFGKKHFQYANELISFYLDNVLKVLDASKDARNMLAESYVAYRALKAPRPTYRQFISEQGVDQSWWKDRLRLLELLGGSHGSDFSYNVPSVLQRIEPFEEALIPESIILDGRQGRHHQALHLLTHGLGDYHTAINYCILGGSSIFYPTTEHTSEQDKPSHEDQCSLFEHLLSEFLKLEDATTSLECTSELLARFGPWFKIELVLSKLPDHWPVAVVHGFLVSGLRTFVHDSTQAAIVKALSGVENLRISAELIEKCELMEPHIVPAMDTPESIS